MHRFYRTLLRWAGSIVLGSCAQDAAPHGANFTNVEGVDAGMCGNTETQFRCWGYVAQIGVSSPAPVVPAPPVNGWRHVSTHYFNGVACGLDGGGGLHCSDETAALAPGLRFTQVSVGGMNQCALATTGVVYCWGQLAYSGVAPDNPGVTTCGTSPYTYECLVQPAAIASSDRFTAIASGDYHHCALSTSGQVLCWGSNAEALGRGPDVADPGVPAPVVGSERYTGLAAFGYQSCGVTSSGGLACWGYSAAFGTGDPYVNYFEPVAIPFPEATSIKSVALGESGACTLDGAGAAWCWGNYLGTGAANSTPLPVLGNLTFRSIAVASGAACGITGTGAWCWGAATGDGSGSWSAIPVRVANQDQFDDD